jgi:hypothetical protein
LSSSTVRKSSAKFYVEERESNHEQTQIEANRSQKSDTHQTVAGCETSTTRSSSNQTELEEVKEIFMTDEKEPQQQPAPEPNPDPRGLQHPTPPPADQLPPF